MKRILVFTLLLLSCGDGRLSPQGGTITSVQPTAGGGLAGGGTGGLVSLGLKTSCSSTQTLAWDGDSWECSTISAFSTNNVIPKGDGTGLVDSLLTSDSTTVTLTRDDGASHANRPILTITNSSVAGALNHRADLQFNVADTAGVNQNHVFQAEGGHMYIGSPIGTIFTAGVVQTLGGAILGDDSALDTHAINGLTTISAGTSTATAGLTGTVLTIAQADGSHHYLTMKGNNNIGINMSTPGSAERGFLRYSTGTDAMRVGTLGTVRQNITSGGGIQLGDTANTAVSNDTDILTLGQTGTGLSLDGLGVAKIADTGTYIGNATTATKSYGISIERANTCSGCTVVNEQAHNNVGLYIDMNGDQVGDGYVYDTALQINRGYSYFGTEVNGQSTYFGNGLLANGTYGVTTSKIQAYWSGAVLVLEGAANDLGLEDWNLDPGNLHLLSNGGTLYLNDSVNQPVSIAAGGGATTIHGTLDVIAATAISGTFSVDGSNHSSSFTETTVSLNPGNDGGTIDIGTSGADFINVGHGLGAITFNNGPTGINNYAGNTLEFVDEFVVRASGTACNSLHVSDAFLCQSSGTGNTWSDAADTPLDDTTAVNGRPGVSAMNTGTTTTGIVRLTTAHDLVDFDDGNWTWEASHYFPFISTVTDEYTFISGAHDTFANANQVDGCYFLYDRGDVAANPNTGDTGGISGDFWSIWCASNSTRTGYKLDGTASEDSFTTVSSAFAEDTWYRLKIVMEGATKARFYINGTERGRITTNIPSGNARGTQMGFQILKSAGTTAAYVYVDQTRITAVLDAVRSP